MTAGGAGRGPLHGLRVLEIGSIGPGPFAAMLLADMGADVLRLERVGARDDWMGGSWNLTLRGRPVVRCDLKSTGGQALALRLAEHADVLLEGFRPGVMERIGLGPEVVAARNPRLVYGRITGYGQDGPFAAQAGHDINYISVAGALGAFARQGERPMFPANLLGDYGGGGMLIAFGVVCAVLEAQRSGVGQVVDASMVDGVALLTTLLHGMRGHGMWSDEAGTNLLDSGAPFYDVYETADGGFVSVGAVEPQFYAELLRLLDLDAEQFPQGDHARWPQLRERLVAEFRARPREEWDRVFADGDACATVVRGLGDAHEHPHNRARNTFVTVDDQIHPAPAPRFSRSTTRPPESPRDPEVDPAAALTAWGIAADELSSLRESGAFGASPSATGAR